MAFGLASTLKRTHGHQDGLFGLSSAAYISGIAAVSLVLGSCVASYGLVTGSALLALAVLVFVVGYAFGKVWISIST